MRRQTSSPDMSRQRQVEDSTSQGFGAQHLERLAPVAESPTQEEIARFNDLAEADAAHLMIVTTEREVEGMDPMSATKFAAQTRTVAAAAGFDSGDWKAIIL